MHDPRCDRLAELLVNFSTRLQPGEKVLIDVFDIPQEMTVALVRAARAAGALPYVQILQARVSREIALSATAEQLDFAARQELARMKNMAAYIAVRDNFNAVWMGREFSGTFNGWQSGGGSIASDPQVAAAGPEVYVTAVTSTGAVWYNTFAQGTGNNWISWTNTGGTLASVTAAASTGPQLFLTGRDGSNQLWWFEAPGAGWKFVGGAGLAAGLLSAGPR